ncbi:methyltransferase domain-containing protein [Micromonospora sp. NPDC005220]|uniref:methyltransferase domain-containing protein n=1 Tax=Micromonospora sp. NPDC005220 TaxID=3155589 RepID=UPI0033BD9024
MSDLLGHRRSQEFVLGHRTGGKPGSMLVLTGGTGSGKSMVLRWAAHALAGDRILDVRDHASAAGVSLRVDRTALAAAVDAIVAHCAGTAETPDGQRGWTVLYDDIDADFMDDFDNDAEFAFPAFVRRIVSKLDVNLLVVTCQSFPRGHVYPMPVEVCSLEHRNADRTEFDEYLDRVLDKAAVPLETFPRAVRTALFQMQTYCPDFRAVDRVLRLLIDRARGVGGVLGEVDLHGVIRGDRKLQDFRAFPEFAFTAGNRIHFRAKDKTEILRDILLGLYDIPEELALIGEEKLHDFDGESFRNEARESYQDTLMTLCMTRSPVELISALLGPRDILHQIKVRELDRTRLFERTEARARLLARGLGFSVTDTPQGLESYQQAVRSAGQALRVKGAERASVEVLRGVGLNLITEIEQMLFELVYFWATLLYGSLRQLVALHNESHTGRLLRSDRLTSGDIAALLRTISAGSTDVRYHVGLMMVRRPKPFGPRLLDAISRYVAARNRLVHPPTEGRGDRRLPTELVSALVDSAQELCEELNEGAFPAVIKLTEVVFDEFGRRTFTAVDSVGRRLRFAVTGSSTHESITGTTHYYMLPARSVVADPVLVPKADMETDVLFRDAEGYAKSSASQQSQAERLIEKLRLRSGESILDVGCGDGRLTIELTRRFPGVRTHGIDISPEMIKTARARLTAAPTDSVTFEEANILDFHSNRQFAVVFSNSSMHWALPPEVAYGRVFAVLADGGQLAVHQGGHQTYSGLWRCALDVVEELQLASNFAGWSYPAYYPTKKEFERLLTLIGFVDLQIEAVESDGHEHPSLIRDFAHAGLLPFLRQVPADKRELFRDEFLRHAEASKPSLYQHRLFALARKP